MKHKYLQNVATLNLTPDKCIGCERCTQVCPHGVFRVEGGKAEILDFNSCMECGACALNCPVGAIAVEAGVGCAYGVIIGWLTGSEPNCDCSSGDISCC